MITQARRAFSADDQLAFAELSGDWTPLLRAPAVHAVQLVTWALDQVVDTPAWIDRVIGWFSRPVPLGVELDLEATEGSCVIRDAGEVVVEINYELAELRDDITTPSHAWPRDEPKNIPPAQLSATPEMIPLALDRKLAAAVAPNLAEHLARIQLAELIAPSRIVGMHGPGVNARIDVLKLTARPGWSTASIGFQVSPVGRRADHVSLSIAGPTLLGHVETSYHATKPQS